MYFAIKPLNNSTYYNRENLEVIRNLQSLGYAPTGRLSTDRQALQIAEYEKLNKTLSPTNEQKIQNAPVAFNTMLKESSAVNKTLTNNSQNKDFVQNKISESLIGTEQIAKLNKQWHNLVA